MRLEQPAGLSPAAGGAYERHARNRGFRGARGRQHHRVRRDAAAGHPALPVAHRRHRQLVGAQAAPAAAGRRGCAGRRRAVGRLLHRPAAANTAIQDEATRFGGGAGSSYNGQVGRREPGRDHAPLPEQDVCGRAVPPDDTETQAPCDTPSLMFDVKASEAGLPLIFQIPGLSDRRCDQRARARPAEAGRGAGGDAARRRPGPALHVCLRNVRERGHGRVARDGAVAADRHERQRPALGDAGRDPRRDRLDARRRPAPPRRRRGSERRLRAALHGVLRPRVDRTASSTSVGGARCRARGPERVASAGLLRPGRLLRHRRLQRRDPGRGRPWRDASSDRHGRDRRSVGERRRQRHIPLTPGGTSGLVTWTPSADCPFAGGGPHTVELNWSWEQTSGTWNGQTCKRNNNPCKASGTFGPVQRAFVAGGRSGPLRRVQVFESGVTSSGSNSFQTGTTPTLGLSIAVTGSLKVQSHAGDPVVELRVTGSQNQSIDCDPAIPNLATRSSRAAVPPTRSTRPRVPRLQRALVDRPSPGDASRPRRVARSARSTRG